MGNTRTFSLIVFTATISALLMYWYMRNHAMQSNTEESPRTICENYDTENMSTLDVDLVHTMVDGYKRNQLDYIQTNPNFGGLNDANSIWFDLKTLKRFLYHIENISKKTLNVPSGNLGVRIYYASYPNLRENAKRFDDIQAMENDSITKHYGNLHTLVMIPTIQDGDGRILDFNPLDVNTYSNGIIGNDVYLLNASAAIPNSNPNPQLNVTGALSSSARHTGSRNHGVLSPPAAAPGLGF